MPRAPPSRPRVKTPEVEESEKIDDPEPVDVESRLVTSMSCQVKKMEETSNSFQINIYLKMDDKMNRQLQAEVTETDTATALAQELVHYGFINEVYYIKSNDHGNGVVRVCNILYFYGLVNIMKFNTNEHF